MLNIGYDCVTLMGFTLSLRMKECVRMSEVTIATMSLYSAQQQKASFIQTLFIPTHSYILKLWVNPLNIPRIAYRRGNDKK